MALEHLGVRDIVVVGVEIIGVEYYGDDYYYYWFM